MHGVLQVAVKKSCCDLVTGLQQRHTTNDFPLRKWHPSLVYFYEIFVATPVDAHILSLPLLFSLCIILILFFSVEEAQWEKYGLEGAKKAA